MPSSIPSNPTNFDTTFICSAYGTVRQFNSVVLPIHYVNNARTGQAPFMPSIQLGKPWMDLALALYPIAAELFNLFEAYFCPYPEQTFHDYSQQSANSNHKAPGSYPVEKFVNTVYNWPVFFNPIIVSLLPYIAFIDLSAASAASSAVKSFYVEANIEKLKNINELFRAFEKGENEKAKYYLENYAIPPSIVDKETDLTPYQVAKELGLEKKANEFLDQTSIDAFIYAFMSRFYSRTADEKEESLLQHLVEIPKVRDALLKAAKDRKINVKMETSDYERRVTFNLLQDLIVSKFSKIISLLFENNPQKSKRKHLALVKKVLNQKIDLGKHSIEFTNSLVHRILTEADPLLYAYVQSEPDAKTIHALEKVYKKFHPKAFECKEDTFITYLAAAILSCQVSSVHWLNQQDNICTEEKNQPLSFNLINADCTSDGELEELITKVNAIPNAGLFEKSALGNNVLHQVALWGDLSEQSDDFRKHLLTLIRLISKTDPQLACELNNENLLPNELSELNFDIKDELSKAVDICTTQILSLEPDNRPLQEVPLADISPSLVSCSPTLKRKPI